MVTEMDTAAAGQALLHRYEDGPGWTNTSSKKEQAYRQGFVEEARRITREWPAYGDEGYIQDAEEQAAHRMRLRLRKRYAVYGSAYGPGCAGRKTHHLGYRPGHAVPAARLRGRHHALAFVTQSWDQTTDLSTFDCLIMPAWLTAVEHWAQKPIRPRKIIPPPRPLEIEGYLGERAKMDPSLRTMRSEDGGSLEAVTSEPPLTSDIQSDPSPPRRLQLTRADAIEMRPPDWLLRGMLERDTFALIFGEPGCGKSFLAIDWACRIATGTPWRGHGVQAGPVVYVAGEGRQGFGRRTRAWQEHNGVRLIEAPLYVAPAVAIPEATQLAELVAAIEDKLDAPALVVLDTLARCFGGGDENSTQDMGRFVSACDCLRQQWGCTVLVVHHTGHADKNRARGAIALKAALDAEYRLVRTENLLLSATKMKEAEIPPPVAMELVTVDLPGLLDDYGSPVTSATVEVLDADIGAIVSKAKAVRPRGKWQEVGFTVAQRLIATRGDGRVSIDAWREACRGAGMIRQNQHRVLEGLVNRGDIALSGDALTIVTT